MLCWQACNNKSQKIKVLVRFRFSIVNNLYILIYESFNDCLPACPGSNWGEPLLMACQDSKCVDPIHTQNCTANEKNFLFKLPDSTITTATLKWHRRKLTFYTNCYLATPKLQANVLNCANFELCIHHLLGDKTVHL